MEPNPQREMGVMILSLFRDIEEWNVTNDEIGNMVFSIFSVSAQ